MRITIQEVRSRTYEVPTDNFNEAKKLAKELLKSNPMNDDDSNGIQFL